MSKENWSGADLSRKNGKLKIMNKDDFYKNTQKKTSTPP
jgi:hypothetical protein